MTVVRWEPVKLLSTFFDTPTTGVGMPATPRRWPVPMDLVEGEDHIGLTLDLPGVRPEDVSIEVADDVLTITGERHAQGSASQGGYLRLERAAGAFRRAVRLPEGIDPEAVAARFEHGVLEIRVPKPEQRRPRRVQIAVEGATQPAIEGESRPAEAEAGAAAQPADTPAEQHEATAA